MPATPFLILRKGIVDYILYPSRLHNIVSPLAIEPVCAHENDENETGGGVVDI
jgi:hypothetical protein